MVEEAVQVLVKVLIGVGAVAIAAFSWWANRRWNDVDSYHEREYADPPPIDAGAWFGGGRL